MSYDCLAWHDQSTVSPFRGWGVSNGLTRFNFYTQLQAYAYIHSFNHGIQSSRTHPNNLTHQHSHLTHSNDSTLSQSSDVDGSVEFGWAQLSSVQLHSIPLDCIRFHWIAFDFIRFRSIPLELINRVNDRVRLVFLIDCERLGWWV